MGQDDWLVKLKKSGGGLQAWLDLGGFISSILATNRRPQSSLFKCKKAY